MADNELQRLVLFASTSPEGLHGTQQLLEIDSALALALVLGLLGLVLTGVYSLSKLSDATEWVNHTDQVANLSQNAFTALVDAEMERMEISANLTRPLWQLCDYV